MGLTDKHLAYGDDIPQTQAEKDYYWELKNLKEKQQVSKKSTDMTIQETVEVVIRIPKEKYDVIMETGNCGLSHNERAIKHGTVLPKGHGRLGDLDRLVRTEIQHLLYHLPNGDIAVPKIDIDNAPTVIEADKDGDTE